MAGTQFLSEQVLLTTLVVKLAVIAALATMLVRYSRFRHILIFERRLWPDRLAFALGLGIPLTAGVAARLLLNYNAADLTLEGSFLADLIAGPYAGATVGAMVGAAPIFNGEWVALPFAIGCGFAGGGLRELCPKEAIWHFSPFVFTTLHRRAWQMVRSLQVDWQVLLLLAPIALEVSGLALGARWRDHHRLFMLRPASIRSTVFVLLATVLCVATPIKIWNNARIEHRLQEQDKLLLAARIEALANQINPHFLFNTLTSISSLIRTQPETARMLITKLSGLLRRLLRATDHFVTLREEIDAIDEYLHIESVRFGPQLRIEKRIHPDTLDIIVPSLILQPLVENSIKHGLSPKVGGGRITITSAMHRRNAIIEVIDDGLGMTADQLEHALGEGIGLSNVNERLRTIYGNKYALRLQSVPGQGTSVSIEIPDVAFLDIQMPGLTGFEVARRMIDADSPTQIIFVTAYDQHAIEAFEVNAVDYLLKPVDPARLELALERARKRVALERGEKVAGVSPEQLEKIVEAVAERRNRRDRLALKVGERFLLVAADEVVYASLADDVITVVAGKHTGTSSCRTLDELQEQLDPGVFWRVHRSHLVNINKVKEIVPWFNRNYLLRMKDEKATEIPVSRNHTRRLREYLKL